MIRINMANLPALDKNFMEFTQRTLEHKCPNQKYVISQLQNYQTQYNKNGLFRDFLLRLEDFALVMEDARLLDIAGIVFSKLAKFPTTDEMKEQFLRSGLRVARKQHDNIHILARIVDLKKLYESSGNKSERYKMLFSEEKTLTDIVENFGKAQGRFRTVSKGHSSIDTYRLQLARTKVDIAKKMKRGEAYPRLMDAREIFEELGYKKELKFVEKMLSNINVSY